MDKYLITDSEIKAAQVQGNLSDRPTQKTLYSGATLTPDQIKAVYDKLPKLIAQKFNKFIKIIPGVTDNNRDDDSLAAMILTGIREGHTLKDLFEEIETGLLVEYLETAINGLIRDRIAEDPNTNGTNAIHYIVGGGTTDVSNNTTAWTGFNAKIKKYYSGLTIAFKVGVVGSETTTLNINYLGAVPVVKNVNTAISTSYAVDSIVLLTYTIDNGTAYWKTADCDDNAKNSAGTSNEPGTKMFLVGATLQTSEGITTHTNTNCYIGEDNRLYSGGEVVPNADEITDLIQEQLGVIENGTY